MKMKNRVNVKILLAIVGFAALNVFFVANVTGTSYTDSNMKLAAMEDYSQSSISLGSVAKNDAVAESGEAAHGKL